MTAFPTSSKRARTWAVGLATALVVGLPAAGLPVAATAATPASTTVAAAAAPAAVSAAATYALGDRVLRRGHRGKDVKKLQKLVKVKVTGYFNAKTAKKVRKIERKYRITPDGIVDARTLKFLKKWNKAEKKRAKKKKSSRSDERPGGSPSAAKKYARGYIDDKYGWGDSQMECLISLWTRESHWNYRASNGRYRGIPQTSSAVWRAAGYSDSEYLGSARVQVKVGTRYIDGRYGTPCKAWSFWKSRHWY